MSAQAARGDLTERKLPVGFCMTIKDFERAKDFARKNKKSFAEFVRNAVLEAMEDERV